MYDIVIFGGTGDLSLRKLLPSLYHLVKKSKVPEEYRILCISRAPLDRVDFLLRVKEKLECFLGDDFNYTDWKRFKTILVGLGKIGFYYDIKRQKSNLTHIKSLKKTIAILDYKFFVSHYI